MRYKFLNRLSPTGQNHLQRASSVSSTSKSLKSLVLSSTLATTIGYGGGQILRLGAHLILARLLFPEAFGLMALVAVLQQGLAMFSDVGIAQSIIQKKQGSSPVYLNTAWTLQAARGIVIWLIICVIAAPFATFYNEPDLARIIPIAGFSAVISGFNSIKLITGNRNLILNKIIAIDFLSMGFSAATMVIWCLITPSIWALVAGGLVSSLVILLAGHIWLPGHDARLSWDKTAANELFYFGGWITLSSMLSFVASMGDRLIFGKLFPIAFLGVYVIAANLQKLPENLIAQLGARVAFPALSRVNRENERAFRLGIRNARLSMGIFGAICAGVMAALSGTMIDFLYDERYSEAGWMLQLLCIHLLLASIANPTGNVILALGDTRNLFFLSMYRAIWLAVVVAPTAYFIGPKEAIITIAWAGLGTIVIQNYFLWRRNYFMPSIELIVLMIALCFYLFSTLMLYLIGVPNNA